MDRLMRRQGNMLLLLHGYCATVTASSGGALGGLIANCHAMPWSGVYSITRAAGGTGASISRGFCHVAHIRQGERDFGKMFQREVDG